MTAALLLCAVAVLAAIATWLVRHYALRASLLDVPNERSSHSVPTPRGGGIGILAALLGGLLVARVLGWIEARLWLALLAGGGLVAAIGFVDDHRHVPARLRAAVHFVAALAALALLGGMAQLRVGTLTVPLGAAGWVLGALGIVWTINLYNFMDGIDGIAGSEALLVGGAGALLATSAGATSVATAAALLAAAAAGFLVWNWAPARIFMGDVGSGTIGYVIAVLAIASENQGGPPLVLWLVLGGVFFFDATITLIRRILHGERFYEAHRRHAYQRAVQAGWSHARVTGAVIIVNVLLGLLAWAALAGTERAPLVLFGALLLLTICYLAVERIRPMYS